jgi:NitT/TauT family transport system ATP-binding protein
MTAVQPGKCRDATSRHSGQQMRAVLASMTKKSEIADKSAAIAPQDDPFVEVDNVMLRYGGDKVGTVALTDTSLSIAEGEFVAVVGPSGCGKSSLLKLVSGLQLPISGSVRVAGAPVTGPLKICGMAFQNATLLPWRTTLANVLLPLEIVEPYASHFRSNRKLYVEKARELLALVGLGGAEDKYPWELSGGMQQRCSLCRALIHEPQQLLLDEPFGALDPFTREELWDVLQEVCRRKRPTVILVTHDLREAVYLADTVYVFSARPGRVLSRTTVDLPRPRRLDDSYKENFIELTHGLRAQIAPRAR